MLRPALAATMALDVNNSTLPPSAIFTVLAYAKLISDCFFTLTWR